MLRGGVDAKGEDNMMCAICTPKMLKIMKQLP